MDNVVVGFGEIMVDFIYEKRDDKLTLLKKDGGGTAWNVLCNLGADKVPVAAVGVCGKDEEGEICIDSLKRFNVDTQCIVRTEEPTKKIYITIPEGNLEDNSVFMSFTSPLTGEVTKVRYAETWVEQMKIPENLRGILVIDNLRVVNETILEKMTKTDNFKIVLDIGHRGFVRNMEKNYLLSFLRKVDVIQMKQSTADCMLQQFELDEKDLFNTVGLEVLIITKGSQGVQFLWKEQEKIKNKEFIIENPVKIVDSCGAGDAFLANFIKHYRNNKNGLNENFFEKVFSEGIKLTGKVVGCIGSRGHLYKEGEI